MTEPQIPLNKDQREALSTAEALEISLDQLTAAMIAIVKWKQRVYQVAIVGVILAAVAIGWAWWSNHSSEISIRSAQINACETSGNALRTGEDQMWHQFIIIATRGKPQPAAQQKIINELLDYADKVFQPVDCKNLYH